ncbi:MAG: heparinase II/III family protein [Hyphomicrobiaceae bacterium]
MSVGSNFTRMFHVVTARRPRVSHRAVSRFGELRHVAPSLRADDPCFVAEWQAGTFAINGAAVTLLGRSPLECHDAPAAWQKALHGFSWLRNVPYDSDDEASVQARLATRALVAQWIAGGRRLPGATSDGDVVARRVLSWLAHSDLLLEDADQRFYDAVMARLAADIRQLDTTWTSLNDEGRIMALVARVTAGLCCTDGAELRVSSERGLHRELERQLTSDGGHVSRSPKMMLALLLDLVPLKHLYAAEHLTMPTALAEAMTRMSTFIAQLRLGDGTLVRLGGGAHDHYDDVAPFGRVERFAPEGSVLFSTSGFGRLAAGATVVVADTGSAATSGAALAFEMSDGLERLVTSAGLDSERSITHSDVRHSTLIFDRGGSLTRRQGEPTLDAPSVAELMVADDGSTTLDATQAGYYGLGVAHRRTLTLDADGATLKGVDTLRPLAGVQVVDALHYAIHFQLDEQVVVTRLGDASSVDLTLASGVSWQFRAEGARLSLETCVLAGPRPKTTLQIVVRGRWPEERALTWQFVRQFTRRDDAGGASFAQKASKKPLSA